MTRKQLFLTVLSAVVYPLFVTLAGTSIWEYLKFLGDAEAKGLLNIKEVTVYDFVLTVLHPTLFVFILFLFIPTILIWYSAKFLHEAYISSNSSDNHTDQS